MLATQTLIQKRPKTMRIAVDGDLPFGVTAKDVILAIIGKIGTAGGTGHVIEYAGSVIRGLSMEGRMTVCNMSIEGGARAGLIAPDDTTFAYLKGRPMSPRGEAWQQAVQYWRTLPSDAGAGYDSEIRLHAHEIEPQVTWGTSPQDVVAITGRVPDPKAAKDEGQRRAMQRSLDYMGLAAGTPMEDVVLDKVFLGSCTNGRIEDLRAAAKGRRRAQGRQQRPRHGRPRLRLGPPAGRAGGPGQGLHRGRLRVARSRLLDVPWHEPGPAGAAGALCVDQQPQLRGPPGPLGPHPPPLAGNGRRRAITGRLTDVRKLVA